MASRLQSWLKLRFLTGLFVTGPIAITAWVLWVFFRVVDDLLSPVYQQFLGHRVPALGFLTAILLILAVGTFATNVVGRRILHWGEGLMVRLPLFGRVYPAVKDLVGAFSPERRSGFRDFVLVEHPRAGVYSYGFVTADVAIEDEGSALVAVFVPTNHLYLGDVVLVPRRAVIPTGLTTEDGIRIVLSAGTASPRRIGRVLTEIPAGASGLAGRPKGP